MNGGYPWYSWFPGDFGASTRGWPPEARLIYRELLDAQWTMGSLPDNKEELQDICSVKSSFWEAGWPRVSVKFERGEDGRLRNPRLERDREKAEKLSERHRRGAIKTNAKRWGTAR